MKFNDATKVEEIVWQMKEADWPRSQNRANINRVFNGEPPWTDQEEQENGVNTNVNFLEGAKIAHDARGQWNNAFLKPGNFFSVTLQEGPIDKKAQWGRAITREINRVMKRSAPYMEVIRSTGASVVLHGIGPVTWDDKYKWCPVYVGIDDLLVPSKTLVSLENLDHFAIFSRYTPGKLFSMTHGAKVDPGWNMSVVRKVLSKINEKGSQSNDDGFVENPEKLAERFKADLGYYESDAVPTIDCWNFYYRDEEAKKEQWRRKIILDRDSLLTGEGEKQFLYDGKKRVYAEDLSQLLHVQFGDGSNVAPFRYHSVRSLGFMLYAVCHLQNRLRCKFNDAVMESMLWYFRVNNPEDEDRIQKIDLHNMGIIPTGLEFVTGGDRFQVDESLVATAMQQNRQNMAENSASFVQNVDSNTKTPITATEAMARVNSGNALVSAMLNMAYSYQQFQYLEIARRFCLKDSTDPDVKLFREKVRKAGVPEKFLDHELWDIEPERVLGAGNKTLEVAQADRLMAVRPLLDPEPARRVLHIFVEANVDDPALAEQLVPLGKKEVSDAVHLAQSDAAVLLMGLPKEFREGINHIDYVEALLASMDAVIQRIEATGGMATQEEIVGLQNLAQTIVAHVTHIGQDPNEKQRVKQYGDIIGKMMNMVRAYQQRLAEAQQQQGNGIPPETAGKIQAMTITAEAQARIKEASAAQKERQKEANFINEQRRKDITTDAEVARKLAQTQADIAATDLTTEADILRGNREPKKGESK